MRLILVPVAGIALAAAWILHQSQLIADDLAQARASASAVDSALAAGDAVDARRALDQMGGALNDAQDRTGGIAWSLAAAVPVAGHQARTARVVVEAAGQIAHTVLPDLVTVAQRLRPAAPSAPGDVVDLRTIGSTAPALDHALLNLRRIRASLDDQPAASTGGQADTALASLRRQTDALTSAVSRAAVAAHLLPPMLGAGTVRRYFLALQTNAEARGTGGLVGAYAILVADHGKVRFEHFGSDDDIPTAAEPVARFGPQYDALYGPSGAARSLTASNLSPHFPYAAAVWAGLWERATGQSLDGAIATDPVGLGYLLAATGPVQLPGGQRISAVNAVQLTEQDAYSRFPDPKQRKGFLVETASAVGHVLETRGVTTAQYVRALTEMAREGRLRVWSAHSSEEALLTATVIGGELPSAPGPFAELVVNNVAGTKLDYYLDRSLQYTLGPCADDGRRAASVRITLTNTAPVRGLPVYVAQRSDAGARAQPAGSNRLWISFYAARGARLTGAYLDGRRFDVASELERGHPVFSTVLDFFPGQRRVIVLALDEPASRTPPDIPVQPLARRQSTRVSAGICGADDRRRDYSDITDRLEEESR